MIGHNSRNTIEFLPLHDSQKAAMRKVVGRKRVQLRAGRRWGKSTVLEQVAGKRGLQGKRVGWFVPQHRLWTPSYARLKRLLAPVVSHSSKTDAVIELEGGGGFEFWTLDNEDAGRSRSYDLAICDEVSLKKKGMREVWEQAIRPTLLDRNGDAIFAGTPKGIDPDNLYYAISQDAPICYEPDGQGDFQVQAGRSPPLKSEFDFTELHIPTWENPHLNAEAVAKLKEENPPLVYLQEYCAQFVDWRGVAFFALPTMLDRQGLPVDFPDRCDSVFATIDTAVKTGKKNDGTGVIFWAVIRIGGVSSLVILDWDIVQIEGGSLETWLPSVFTRLEEYARQTRARNGSLGAWIEDKASGSILLQQARKRGWPAHDIDSVLTSLGKEERALNVSGYVFQKKVMMSRNAHDKTVIYKQQSRNHLISQVCGFRMGEHDPLAQDDLLDAFTYGVAIALGDSEGY